MAAPTCTNCGTLASGRYCSACGQQQTSLQVALWRFIGQILNDAFAMDGRLVRTLGLLVFKPGVAARRYCDGKRARFVPPVRLYLAATLITLLVLLFVPVALVSMKFEMSNAPAAPAAAEQTSAAPEPGMMDTPTQPASANIIIGDDGRITGFGTELFAYLPPEARKISAAEARQFREILESSIGETDDEDANGVDIFVSTISRVATDPMEMNQLANSWLPQINLLLMPLTALALALLYIRRRVYLVEHAIFTLHYYSLFSLSLLVSVLIIWALGVAGFAGAGGESAAFFYFAFNILHLYAAMKSFYQQGWVKTGMKTLFIAVLNVFFAVLVTSAIVFLTLKG